MTHTPTPADISATLNTAEPITWVTIEKGSTHGITGVADATIEAMIRRG